MCATRTTLTHRISASSRSFCNPDTIQSRQCAVQERVGARNTRGTPDTSISNLLFEAKFIISITNEDAFCAIRSTPCKLTDPCRSYSLANPSFL